MQQNIQKKRDVTTPSRHIIGRYAPVTTNHTTALHDVADSKYIMTTNGCHGDRRRYTTWHALAAASHRCVDVNTYRSGSSRNANKSNRNKNGFLEEEDEERKEWGEQNRISRNHHLPWITDHLCLLCKMPHVLLVAPIFYSWKVMCRGGGSANIRDSVLNHSPSSDGCVWGDSWLCSLQTQACWCPSDGLYISSSAHRWSAPHTWGVKGQTYTHKLIRVCKETLGEQCLRVSYAVVLLMSRTLCRGSMVSGQRSMQGANTMARALADMRFVSSWNKILNPKSI